MKAANMASWVYDVNKKVFNPLYGLTVAKKNMPMEAVLDILHPQDRAPLIRLFSQLIGNEIEQGQMTLRFYNEQEEMYRYYESRMRLSTEHRGKLADHRDTNGYNRKVANGQESAGSDRKT